MASRWESKGTGRILGKYPETVTEHGNAKKSKGEFIRSNPRVIEALKKWCISGKAKPRIIYQDAKLNTNSEIEKPRNFKQVQNMMNKTPQMGKSAGFKVCSSKNFADEIQSLCSSVTTHDFIQSVSFTKGHSPIVIIYTDNQINDIVAENAGCDYSLITSMYIDYKRFALINLYDRLGPYFIISFIPINV